MAIASRTNLPQDPRRRRPEDEKQGTPQRQSQPTSRSQAQPSPQRQDPGAALQQEVLQRRLQQQGLDRAAATTTPQVDMQGRMQPQATPPIFADPNALPQMDPRGQLPTPGSPPLVPASPGTDILSQTQQAGPPPAPGGSAPFNPVPGGSAPFNPQSQPTTPEQQLEQTLMQRPDVVARLQQMTPQDRQLALENLLMNQMRQQQMVRMV